MTIIKVITVRYDTYFKPRNANFNLIHTSKHFFKSFSLSLYLKQDN